jgi:DNA-binding transcriptional ArsR family regulator
VIEIFTSTRVQILSKLRERPFTVSEIAKLTGYSKTTVSYHLSKLSEAGLVERVERGKWVYYRITHRGERRIKVEAAVSIASLVGAAVSIVWFAVIRMQKATVKLVSSALERGIAPVYKIQKVGGFEYEYLLVAVAAALICVFLYLKLKR